MRTEAYKKIIQELKKRSLDPDTADLFVLMLELLFMKNRIQNIDIQRILKIDIPNESRGVRYPLDLSHIKIKSFFNMFNLDRTHFMNVTDYSSLIKLTKLIYERLRAISHVLKR